MLQTLTPSRARGPFSLPPGRHPAVVARLVSRYPLLQPVIVMGLEMIRIATGVSPWSREQSSQQTYNQVLWYTKNAHSGGVSVHP